jgi:hypothetical protein
MGNIPSALYDAIQMDVQALSPTMGDVLNDPAYFGKLEALSRFGSDYLKKFEQSNPDADKAAYTLFHEFNSRCKTWALPESLSETDRQLWGTFLMLVEDFFLYDVGKDCELSWSAIAGEARHGPGAAVGSLGTSFYAKSCSSPLSATSRFLIELYETSLCVVPYAVTAECFRRTAYGPPAIVRGSKFAVVPKNDKIGRLICVEPPINQYFQLGAGRVIERRLERILGLDIRTQTDVNRRLAFLGSSGLRSLATVDLKSASDSLSLALVSACVPPEVFTTLVSLRSAEGQVQGSWSTLNMMSTMGNGFTFPLQTVLFSCAVLAALECNRDDEDRPGNRHRDRPRLRASGGDWSVFGDDIIIDAAAYPKLERLLELMGCVVNSDKTFVSGSFRESCGCDFYHGYNVRPVYLRSLKTRADLTVALNQLITWSCRTGMFPYYTFDWLLKAYERKFGRLNLVPLAENDDAGLRVPLAIPEILLSGGAPVDHNGSYIYESRIARPRKYTVRDSGRVVGPKGAKSLSYNPDGLLRAFLLGEIRSGQIIARCNGPVPYSTTRKVTPNWDYLSPPSVEQGFGFVSADSPQSWWGIVCLMLDAHVRHCISNERHYKRKRGAKNSNELRTVPYTPSRGRKGKGKR